MVHDGPGDEHFAARRPVGDSRRDVDIAAEVVAVSVQGLAVVDPDPGQWTLGLQALEPDRPVDQR